MLYGDVSRRAGIDLHGSPALAQSLPDHQGIIRYLCLITIIIAAFQEFDIINMSNRKLERFIGIVRAFYKPQSYRMHSADELEEDAEFGEELQKEQQ